jgi:predicted nucleic acid-binding protein
MLSRLFPADRHNRRRRQSRNFPPSAVLSAEGKRLTAILTEAITDGRVAMIGPIRQELLSGVKEQAQFNRLRSALAAFRDEGIATVDYEEAARLYNLCRSRGVECAPVDILICALARRRKWDVLANDSVMKRCVAVIAEHG